MTIPAPSDAFISARAARPSAREVYPELDGYFDDVAAAYRKAIRAFYDAGCRYLQLDDTAWAMVCRPAEREGSRKRGDDPDALPARYARMTNAALAGRPADMVITMHSCRGNFRSTLIAAGRLRARGRRRSSARSTIDGYFMEYDSRARRRVRTAALRPQGPKQVVLGLVTSKSGTLEGKDEIKRRIDEAAKYVDIEQLCLSPQCGFASTEEGNILAEDEQWAKLRMIVEVADEVWGKILNGGVRQ